MIKGLEKLQRQMAEAQEVLQNLDGDLCTVNFDPYDPASIETAIHQIMAVIDERVGQHHSNPIIGPLAEQMKAQYRADIIDRAATSRLKGTE
jgi:hypothetical protein